MPAIKKQKRVPYQQAEMYALVNDISSYSAFVPFCVESRIVSQSDDDIQATLSFARGGLRKSFTTLNRLKPPKMVEIRLVNGPFKHLEGFWRFDQLDDGGCQVRLDLEFEFSSRIMAMMFGPFFNQVASMLVDAFCKRADVVYGQQA